MSRKTIAKTNPREERLAGFTPTLYVDAPREGNAARETPVGDFALSNPYRFRPRIFRVAGDPALHRLLCAVAASSRARGADPARRRPVLLDSAAGEPRRFSLFGLDPVATVGGESLLGLRGALARLAFEPGDAEPPGFPDAFRGGFLGALAYDLGVVGEELALPSEPWGFPRIVGGLYVDFFVRDERRGATWLVLGDEPGDGRAPVAERRDELLDASARDAAGEVRPLSALERCTAPQEHQARIRRAQEAIRAGEIYQANVAHRLLRRMHGDPVDLYLALRAANPAPYMGYLAFEGGAVLSSSPELLLELGPESPGPAGSGSERLARTRPIKGTAPRGATPAEDAARAAELLASAKDLAELAMIVDLERNDLGRIAAVGSVRVEGFPRLQSFAAVHHLVADVVARPRADVDAVAVLAALFPGGSITGAPKLRAMEVIAELEGEGRGFFTGSLGLLDTRGRAAFNILIRTLLWRPAGGPGGAGGEISFRVGGGITWASDAAREDAETLDKARAMAAALEPR
jgi:para-aminobenzoate synthetase component 1